MFAAWFDSEVKQGNKLWNELVKLHDELHQDHVNAENLDQEDFKNDIGKWNLEKLSNAVQLNTKRSLGEKLVDAAANGDVRKVRKLLKMEEIDIDYQNQEESATALMKACEMGWVDEDVRRTPERAIELVRILLGRDPPPDLNIQDEAGWTALMVASANSRYSDAKLVRILLKHKPHPNANIFSLTGWTACMLAAREGNSEVIDALLNHSRVDLNQQSNDGVTAMMLSAQNISNRIFQRLLNHDPPPDLTHQDDHGRTVFNYAVQRVDKRSDNRVIYSLRNRFFFPEPNKVILFNSMTSVTEVSRGIFATTYWGALVIGETKRWKQGVKVTLPVFCKVPTYGTLDDWHEFQTLKKLPHHPNVHYLLAMCNDFHHKDNIVSAMVLLYKEGGALRAHLDHRKEPLSFERLVEFGFRMSSGLHHVHKYGFKHNDVAARNFLLTEKEDDKWGSDLQQFVVLSEFWLSRRIDEERQKEDGLIVPWRWAAPETLASLGVETSPLSDVWMLGISFWELLAIKECPFHWLSTPDDIVDLSEKEGHAPLIFPIWCRQSWIQLILKCCAFEPHSRPSSKEIMDELEEMRESLVVTKEEEPKPRPLAEFEQERKEIREREKQAAEEGKRLNRIEKKTVQSPRITAAGGAKSPRGGGGVDSIEESESDQQDDEKKKPEKSNEPAPKLLSSSNLMAFEIEYQRHKQKNRKVQSVMMNTFKTQLDDMRDKVDDQTYFEEREEFDDVFEWADESRVDLTKLERAENNDPQYSGIYYKVPDEKSEAQGNAEGNSFPLKEEKEDSSNDFHYDTLQMQLDHTKEKLVDAGIKVDASDHFGSTSDETTDTIENKHSSIGLSTST